VSQGRASPRNGIFEPELLLIHSHGTPWHLKPRSNGGTNMATIDPRKRRVVADIIARLHHGLSIEDAKTEILRDVGTLSSSEITEIEQGLINEGVPADEIRRFCNVHALLFESALEQTVASPDAPSHPVNMLKRENREIEKLVK